MSDSAISTSCGLTSTSISSSSKAGTRISSGHFIVSRTRTSSAGRIAQSRSFSRIVTLPMPTWWVFSSASMNTRYALRPDSSGAR